MINKKNIKKLHGQSVLEYVLLVGIITVVLSAMFQLIKRGSQSLVKVAADELSVQKNSDQTFSNQQGYLDHSDSQSQSQNYKQVIDRLGVINYIVDDKADAVTNSQTNLGFTEEN